MNKFIVLICIFALGGCQTDSKSTVTSGCDSLRAPAETTVDCKQILIPARLPSDKEISQFFDKLETDYDVKRWQIMSAIEKNYSVKNYEVLSFSYSSEQLGNYPRSVTAGQILAERRKLNESTAKTLTSLGYREQMGQLMPPRNLDKLYADIYKNLFESAQLAGVSPKDMILPALLFEKLPEYRFVRPGIDSLPPASEGWHLSFSAGELSAERHSRMIREHKLSMSPGIFFHDSGHLVDLIERPLYARALVEYENKKLAANSKYAADKEAEATHLGPLAFRGDMFRYYNEWTFLPPIEKLSEIRNVIPDIAVDELKPLSEYVQKYSDLTRQNKIKIARLFLKNRYLLFVNHGGGARDWSIERNAKYDSTAPGFDTLMPNYEGYYERAHDDREKLIPPLNSDQIYLWLEVPGIFKRIEVLVQVLENQNAPERMVIYLESMAKRNNAENKEAFYLNLLSLHLAEIQYRLQAALKFKITPEKLVSDTTLLYSDEGFKAYQNTDTFHYYSTYRRNSLQWYYAVDIARPAILK